MQRPRTPLLDWLARTYAKDWTTARGALIRPLLADALKAWREAGDQPHADLVDHLFFVPPGTAPEQGRSGVRLDTVRKQTVRSRASFDKYRQGVFGCSSVASVGWRCRCSAG